MLRSTEERKRQRHLYAKPHQRRYLKDIASSDQSEAVFVSPDLIMRFEEWNPDHVIHNDYIIDVNKKHVALRHTGKHISQSRNIYETKGLR